MEISIVANLHSYFSKKLTALKNVIMRIICFLTSELGEGTGGHLLNSQALILGDAGRQTEAVDAAANTDAAT